MNYRSGHTAGLLTTSARRGGRVQHVRIELRGEIRHTTIYKQDVKQTQTPGPPADVIAMFIVLFVLSNVHLFIKPDMVLIRLTKRTSETRSKLDFTPQKLASQGPEANVFWGVWDSLGGKSVVADWLAGWLVGRGGGG